MFKIGDEVVIVNKKWKNFGKTAVIQLIDGWSNMIQIKTIETSWVRWVYPADIEPVNVKSERQVPFIAFSDDNKNMTVEQIRGKIENDHDDTTVMFGDTFENMKDQIINRINDTWGYDDWDSIYVVCGEDYYHIGKEVVVKKL